MRPVPRFATKGSFGPKSTKSCGLGDAQKSVRSHHGTRKSSDQKRRCVDHHRSTFCISNEAPWFEITASPSAGVRFYSSPVVGFSGSILTISLPLPSIRIIRWQTDVRGPSCSDGRVQLPLIESAGCSRGSATISVRLADLTAIQESKKALRVVLR
jgi:hypothetical protein